MHSSPIPSASFAPTASLENQVKILAGILTVFYWSTMIEPRKPIRFFQVNARKTDLIESSTIVETPGFTHRQRPGLDHIHVYPGPSRAAQWSVSCSMKA